MGKLWGDRGDGDIMGTSGGWGARGHEEDGGRHGVTEGLGASWGSHKDGDIVGAL